MQRKKEEKKSDRAEKLLLKSDVELIRPLLDNEDRILEDEDKKGDIVVNIRERKGSLSQTRLNNFFSPAQEPDFKMLFGADTVTNTIFSFLKAQELPLLINVSTNFYSTLLNYYLEGTGKSRLLQDSEQAKIELKKDFEEKFDLYNQKNNNSIPCALGVLGTFFTGAIGLALLTTGHKEPAWKVTAVLEAIIILGICFHFLVKKCENYERRFRGLQTNSDMKRDYLERGRRYTEANRFFSVLTELSELPPMLTEYPIYSTFVTQGQAQSNVTITVMEEDQRIDGSIIEDQPMISPSRF